MKYVVLALTLSLFMTQHVIADESSSSASSASSEQTSAQAEQADKAAARRERAALKRFSVCMKKTLGRFADFKSNAEHQRAAEVCQQFSQQSQ